MNDENIHITVEINGFVFKSAPLESLKKVAVIGDVVFGSYISEQGERHFSSCLEPEEYCELLTLTEKIKERIAREIYERRNIPVLKLDDIKEKFELEPHLDTDENEQLN